MGERQQDSSGLDTGALTGDEERGASVYGMKVNFMEQPLGIDDESPSFGWKMKSNRRGAKQSAYRLTVTEETSGEAVWDSGRVVSGISVGIRYQGGELKRGTRYLWQVSVWDEAGDMLHSSPSWFETGLMGTDASVWDGAKWIGSPKPSVNTAALGSYALSVKFRVSEGSKAGIVLAARNKDNYVLFELDMDSRIVKAYEYTDNAWNGRFADGNEPSVNPLGNPDGYVISPKAVADGQEHSEHKLTITVDGRDVSLQINGEMVIDEEKDMIPCASPIQPKKDALMSIGFKQVGEGNRAVYDDLKMIDTATGEVYQDEDFSTDAGAMSSLGEVHDGKLVVENRFELICPVPAVNLTRAFHVEKKVVSARLYAAARGFYDAYINGKRVGDEFFNPGFTDYRLRIQYRTFDVTDMLRSGENRIGAIVGKGHYSGFCGYNGAMQYGRENSFVAKLVLTYTDGTRQSVVTDESWKFTDKGPLVDSDYFDGETYDARLEFDGWGEAGYDDSGWTLCGVKDWPGTPKPTNGELSGLKFVLSAQDGPAARIEMVLKPNGQAVENPKGHFVYDFGQNMVGTIRLRVRGKRGTSIKLRYGEMTYGEGGELYIENLRSAANTDVYTLRGDEDGETFLPLFTSHGFRYVEITGNGFVLAKEDIEILSLEGLVINNLTGVTGDFTCSNALVNQLQKNIQWGERGNSLLVLTDCPQRNERMGWTGDAQVFAATGAYNMDMAAFAKKWLQDVIDGQLMYNKNGAVPDTAPMGGDNRPDGCAGWADAAVIVPWELYRAYGDPRILEQCYDMMAKWISYQERDDRQYNGLRTVDGKDVPQKSDLSNLPYIQVQQSRGDHLAFDHSTPFILTATAYAAHVADLMAQTAQVLGKTEDAARYRKRFELVRKAFQEAWVQEDGSLAYWGEMSTWRGMDPENNIGLHGEVIRNTYYSNDADNIHHPSQTAYALAIAFDLIPPEKLVRAIQCFRQAVKDNDGKLTVGFLGVSHLAPALTKAGLSDLAFSLLEEEGNPSWLYSVKNGATTIWERWNSYIADDGVGTFGNVLMNSFNHYSYGAIGEWMYQTILGIRPCTGQGEAGYKKFILKPTVGGTLTYAKGYHESSYGKIVSGWSIEQGRFLYDCTIPANTEADVYLPAKGADSVREGEVLAGEAPGITHIGVRDDRVVFHLESGTYRFSMDIK